MSGSLRADGIHPQTGREDSHAHCGAHGGGPLGNNSRPHQRRAWCAVAALASGTEELVTGVAAERERIQARIEQIVGTVGLVALGPVAAVVVVSFVPLVVILLPGWWST